MLVKLAKTRMRRKIPIIRITLKNGATVKEIQEQPSFQQTIREELILAIEEGVKKKKNSIVLFLLGESHQRLELKRTEWKKSLRHLIKIYSEKDQIEDYLLCAKIRDLMEQI